MKLLGNCGYTRDDIQAILNSPVPFTKDGGEREVDLAEVSALLWVRGGQFSIPFVLNSNCFIE